MSLFTMEMKYSQDKDTLNPDSKDEKQDLYLLDSVSKLHRESHLRL